MSSGTLVASAAACTSGNARSESSARAANSRLVAADDLGRTSTQVVRRKQHALARESGSDDLLAAKFFKTMPATTSTINAMAVCSASNVSRSR
jgi:hypothetical protein